MYIYKYYSNLLSNYLVICAQSANSAKYFDLSYTCNLKSLILYSRQLNLNIYFIYVKFGYLFKALGLLTLLCREV